MTHDNNANPYEPPGSDQPAQTLTPSLGLREDAFVSGIVVGTLFGVCVGFGGSYFAIPYINADPNLQWVFSAIWLVGAITGLATAIHVGRKKYRDAVDSSHVPPATESEGDSQ